MPRKKSDTPKKGQAAAKRTRSGPAKKPSRKRVAAGSNISSPPPFSPDPVRAPAPPASSHSQDYDSHRSEMAARSRATSAKGREIGAIPDIADVNRRERCRGSLRHFCETYNPKAFALGWSPDHLKAIARIEEAVTGGALFAFAMARGSGKTTLCRHAALWAASYAHCRYPFLIGATDDKACETLDTLRILIRFLDHYAEDFPEVSWPARCLQGIANRATGQTCGGESTLIEWSADRIVLPTVPPPANWPAAWPLRQDRMVPTSGILISASGLTGEGIRGSLKTLTTGEGVRPDFVLLDDPQTPESARSPTQNDTRLRLVSADVLGMAGPDKAIAAVMPCTVIEPGDMVDRVLDRSQHPLWRGERSGILRSMPADLAAWDRYFELYGRCAQLEPPDFAESNAHYLAHRAALDAGAEASWADRKKPGEVSAVQSAMHLYFRDKRAFMAEFMNDPQPSGSAAAAALDAGEVAARVTNLARGMVPRACTRVTAFVDVGAHLLWYLVAAWDERFGGQVIDYGPYPDQGRAHFAATDPRPGLQALPEFAGRPQEAAVYGGLTAVATRVLGRVYRQEETGADLRVERCLVDANWGPATDLVYEFCRRSPHAAVLLPSHGKFVGASSNPMATWQTRPGERAGWGWRLSAVSSARGRHLVFDANQWKTFAAERLRTPEGAPGCVRLFAPGPAGTHRLLGDHCTAEYPVCVARQAGGRAVDEWKAVPGRDNHLWDCLIGACVAASVCGLAWSAAAAAGEGPGVSRGKKKVNIEELYRRQQKGDSR